MSTNIIVIDSRGGNADTIVEKLYQIVDCQRGDIDIQKFSDYRDAVGFAEIKGCDIAFVMVDGIRFSPQFLVKSLQRLNPRVNIIFCGQGGNFLDDSWKLGLSGYLSLPVRKRDLIYEIEELRYRVWIPIRDEMIALY